MTKFTLFAATAAALVLTACASMGGGGGAHLGKPLKAADYAAILADPGRPAADKADDAARKPAELLEFAGIRPGSTVLEMEVGRGWMTELLSKAVGPTGKVITQNPAEFAYSAPAMAARRKDGRLANVTDITSHFDDLSKIPDHSVDEALWILGPHETYFHPNGANLGDPAKSFAELRRVLKPGATLIVMDHAADASAPTSIAQTLHRIPPAAAMKLATDAGFKLQAKSDLLANPQDDRTKPVFNNTIRRHTDQFLWKFKS